MGNANLGRAISWIAGIVAAIVAITLPLGYFIIAYRSLATELSIEADFRSARITNFINESPDTWTIRHHHLDELLEFNPPRRKEQSNRLFNLENKQIDLSKNEPAWPAIRLTTDVYDAGRVVGYVEVKHPIRGLLQTTAIVGLFALLLGSAVFVALRVLPLRALNRATKALQDEVDQHALARAAAETANRAKSQFLAAASHDLRQPLHALGLFAASLSEKERDPDVRAIVDNISASVEALEALFTELLDISKLDAGIIQPVPAPFALKPVFDRLRLDYEAQAKETGLRLRIMPSSAFVYSDSTLLERILRNLIGNAIRYTNKGGVVVGCRLRGDQYSIEVWDSGVGIPADKLDKIFEEFYQVGNPERDRTKGLGLGLAIVKRLEQLLGYRIEVSSRPGRGSVFRFRVPRAHTEALGHKHMTGTKVVADALQNKCILVIDDEFAVREGMKALLSGWGCDVIAAESLPDALQRIGEHALKPDAILADYRLRDGANGIEVIQSLHAEFGSDIPALLITGDIASDSLRQVRESGYAQLHKPVPPAALRAALQSIFSKNLAKQERIDEANRWS